MLPGMAVRARWMSSVGRHLRKRWLSRVLFVEATALAAACLIHLSVVPAPTLENFLHPGGNAGEIATAQQCSASATGAFRQFRAAQLASSPGIVTYASRFDRHAKSCFVLIDNKIGSGEGLVRTRFLMDVRRQRVIADGTWIAGQMEPVVCRAFVDSGAPTDCASTHEYAALIAL